MGTRGLTNLVWCAFFMGVLVYHALIISRVLPQQEAGAAGALLGAALLLLAILQLLTLVALDVFLVSRPRKLRVTGELLDQLLPPGGAPVDEALVARRAKAAYYLRLFVLLCALAEAVGIYGLVLYLLGGAVAQVHTILGLAYVSLLYVRMRMATTWERMYLG